MIRINLLTVEKAKKKSAGLPLAHRLTIGCSLILAATIGGVGWWFVALNRASAKLDNDIAAAQQETARLRTIIQQVQQFEQQRAQLEQRVTLIEQLRRGQTGPVHMLDQISRALPSMLWLTELKQLADSKTANEVVIDGRSTTYIGVTDFVKNLEDSGYFKKSIDIVSTSAEAIPQPPGELVKFELRAQFQAPEPPKPAPPAAGAAGKKGP